MRNQFVMFCAARRHGQNLCADKSAARHVELRVADDNNFFRLQMFAEHATSALERRHGDVIALLVVVRKAAEMKRLPKPEVAQLEFRAELDIACEQAQHRRIRQRLQIADETVRAATRMTVAFMQNEVEAENVVLEKFPEILQRRRDAVDAEQFPDEAHIRASGKVDHVDAFVRIERRLQRARKSHLARAAGIDERAVHIE